jgi:hypothetical protein
VSRRQFLRIGGFGSLGLALPALLRAEAEGQASRGSADGHAVTSPIRSCILIAMAEAAAKQAGKSAVGTAKVLDPRDAYFEKALRILHSPAVAQAFHRGSEDPRLRDRYGRTKFGQSVLLARRLVGAGVRFVTVHDGQYNSDLRNWDSHENLLDRRKNHLLPPADQAFAALIDDLFSLGGLIVLARKSGSPL